MPKIRCRRCHRAILSAEASGPQECAQCRQAAAPDEPELRWFVGHQNKKYGPFTWQRLVALAQRGELDPEVMLFKEKSDRWVRAGTLQALFAPTPPAPPAPAPAPPAPAAATVRVVHAPKPEPAARYELEALLDYINELDAVLKPGETTDAPPPADDVAAELEPAATEAEPTPLPDAVLPPPEPVVVPITAAPAETHGEARAEPAPPIVVAPAHADEPAPAPQPNIVVVRPAAPPPAPVLASTRDAWSEPAAVEESLPSLLSRTAPAGTVEKTPSPRPRRQPWTSLPWVMEGLAAASVTALLTASLVMGFFVIDWIDPAQPPGAEAAEQVTGNGARDHPPRTRTGGEAETGAEASEAPGR